MNTFSCLNQRQWRKTNLMAWIYLYDLHIAGSQITIDTSQNKHNPLLRCYLMKATDYRAGRSHGRVPIGCSQWPMNNEHQHSDLSLHQPTDQNPCLRSQWSSFDRNIYFLPCPCLLKTTNDFLDKSWEQSCWKTTWWHLNVKISISI